jgi:acyl-CoA synthetase (AMP-forming)/AMP-acid ligase II
MDGGEDLRELLSRAATLGGEAPFLAVGGQTLTFAELNRRVIATARGLVARGFGRGDRLAIHVHRCGDETVALLAAAVAGGIAVPIHSKLKDDQVLHVLDDCTPWAVVASATRGALLLDRTRVLAGRRVFVADSGPLDAAAAPGERFADLQQSSGDLPPLAPTEPAILLYTSGSTGLSKGVIQDHQNLRRGAAIVANYLQLSSVDHILAVLPFSFDYGLNQLLSALHAGCRVTAADFLGLGELAALLQTVRPTGLAGVPSLWHEVARGLQSGALLDRGGQSLRYITNSGGHLAIDDLRTIRATWPQLAIFAMYGLTEAFRSAFLDPAEIDAHPTSFGRALPSVELLLVDPDTGVVLQGPATGELVHAGALVARGYWNRPEATKERFRPDPRGTGETVVYSGDLVRRDEAGRLYFVARRDRMLKVQGHRISPDEVAQALQGWAGVGEVAVWGRDGGAQGHRIVVAVAGDPRDPELKQRILRQCRSRLPTYMVPAVVRVLDALPHTQNGKIDVKKLEREDPCTDTA